MAHPVRRFTKKIFVFCNIFIAILFLLGCYSYWFNPQHFWFIGVLTLASFYLLLILAGFLIFWLLVKPRLMLISFISIVLAWQPLHQLIELRLSNDFVFKKSPEDLRVMSWNVEHFLIAEHKKHPEKKQEMLRLINRYQPDVACFQEMVASDSVPGAINYLPDFAKELGMPYTYFSYNPKLDYDRNHRFGIIIFSKYPFLHEKSISYTPNDYNSIFQYVDIQKEQDTVRVFNLHFQSLRFTDQDLQYIEEPTIDEETNFKQSRDVLYKFKIGFLKRQIQSERAKEEINKSPYRVVVCGDFNDVPNSYAYTTIGKGLQNAFSEKGSGIGRTFSHITPTLRIDNIFTDQGFSIKQFTRDTKKISDHFPIIADVHYNKP
jgi:endonuclease/exonuclease/phosphatase family metal-dependent hydrolase